MFDIMRTPRLFLPSTLLVALLTSCAVLLSIALESQVTARARLLAVLDSVRPVEGRLVSLNYAPIDGYREVKRSKKLVKVVRRIKAGADKESLETVKNLVLIDVVTGNYSRASTKLTSALSRWGSDAELLSDRAALCIELAEKEPYYLAEALIAAKESIRSDPSLLEARFNYALALEKVGVQGAAENAWREYIVLDSYSEWADEAKRHIELITRSNLANEKNDQDVERALLEHDVDKMALFVPRNSQLARKVVEETILPNWGRAFNRGDEKGARRSIMRARAIGVVLEKLGHDRMIMHAVDRIDEARSKGDLANLSRGHEAYGEGVELVAAGNYEDALQEFEVAYERLDRGKSPFASWANFQSAYCYYQVGNAERALEILLPISREALGQSFLPLAGRAFWLIGTIKLIRPFPLESIESYRKSFLLFEESGERGNRAAVGVMLANNYDYLGDSRSAWKYRRDALRGLKSFENDRRYRIGVSEAARSMMKLGNLYVALDFQSEAVKVAEKMNDPLEISLALRERANIFNMMGDNNAALRDITSFYRYASRIKSPAVRNIVEGEALFVSGKIKGFFDASEGIGILTQAIEFHAMKKYEFLLPEIYYERSRLYLSSKNYREAEADLRVAFSRLGNLRVMSSGTVPYAVPSRKSREIVRAMIEFQIRYRHSPESALRYVEKANSWRSRAEVRGNRVEWSLDPDADFRERVADLQVKLGQDHAVVVYSVLSGSLCIWVLRNDQVEFRETVVDVSYLRRIAEGLSDVRDATQWRYQANILYQYLISPVQSDLPSSGSLIIVPDDFLYGIPFSALYSKESGEYTLERWGIVIARNVESALSSTEEEGSFRWRDQKLLAVDGSFFRSDLFPSLSKLRGTQDEVEMVAQYFKRHELLLGERATRNEFLKKLSTADLVHLAAHGLSNESNPFLSALLLAPKEKGDTGVIYALDLMQGDWSKTRLVVLAGCRTGEGGLGREEGTVSLATSLLSSGVPTVLASYWSIDDVQSSRFFSSFYSQIADGATAGQALRATKLELLYGQSEFNSPFVWGAFELLHDSTRKD